MTDWSRGDMIQKKFSNKIFSKLERLHLLASWLNGNIETWWFFLFLKPFGFEIVPI